MDREGQGDKQSERLSTPEGDPDSHTFREGMDRHYPHHEHRLACIECAHAGEDGRVLFVLDHTPGHHDKEEPQQNP